ncbi:MAG TPA: pyridoxal-phosphate dependent enzyme [Clostridia bacterium]|nr:pyridoxal-phosphate dependent enzyme [Clostridia bacterium]
MAEKSKSHVSTAHELPGLHSVFEAQKRIEDVIWETPLVDSPAAARESGAAEVLLKLESLQNTGAFKVRGAANKILGLSDEDRSRGVITFSTGNHGKAVSFVSGKTGIKAVVCLSEHVPAYRVQKIRELGAEVEVKGHSQDEAEEHYYRLMESRGMVPVVPFDDPAIVSGQGTIALEMLRRRPELDMLLVPLSGGGLLAGIAMAAKSINPNITVVGVSISQSPAMLESVKAGHPVAVEEKDTLADSLLGGIGRENNYTLPLIQKYVDQHVVIDEAEIEKAMVYAYIQHSLVIEGASAVGIAAIQSGKLEVADKRIATVISGSSVDPAAFLRVLQKHVH